MHHDFAGGRARVQYSLVKDRLVRQRSNEDRLGPKPGFGALSAEQQVPPYYARCCVFGAILPIV